MEEQNINQDILDKLTKVCLCKGISKTAVKNAIINGAKTVEEVKIATGAAGGSCRGKRCADRILDLINQFSTMQK